MLCSDHHFRMEDLTGMHYSLLLGNVAPWAEGFRWVAAPARRCLRFRGTAAVRLVGGLQMMHMARFCNLYKTKPQNCHLQAWQREALLVLSLKKSCGAYKTSFSFCRSVFSVRRILCLIHANFRQRMLPNVIAFYSSFPYKFSKMTREIKV